MILPHCPRCDQSGRVFVPETRSFGFCECYPRLISLLSREKAEIRSDYWEATFDIFEPRQEFPNQQQVLDFCRAYAAQWPGVKASGRCLTILGAKTTMGKSHLAVAIALEISKNYWTRSLDQDVCLFVNVTNWFKDWSDFKERFPSPAQGSPLWDDLFTNPEYRKMRDHLAEREARMKTTELLILDDLAAFESTPRRLERLYDLVDFRVSNRLPIVSTDNRSSWAQISNKLGGDQGPRITDRLIRNGETVVVEMAISKRGRKKSL